MANPLALAALGAGLLVGARWARRRLEQVASERQKAELRARSDTAKPSGDLAPDPGTGIYQPRA
ncbi:MAG: hypothetical protein AAFQ35_00710 [Pseudomonadota bacterium]